MDLLENIWKKNGFNFDDDFKPLKKLDEKSKMRLLCGWFSYQKHGNHVLCGNDITWGEYKQKVTEFRKQATGRV